MKKKPPEKKHGTPKDNGPERPLDSWENPFSYPLGDPMDEEDQVPPFSAFTLQDHDPLTVPYPDETAPEEAERPPDSGKRRPAGKPRSAADHSPARPPRRGQGGQPSILTRSGWKAMFFLSAVLLLSLTAAVLIRRARWIPFRSSADALENERFFAGVTVDGIDVSGMTYSQAENVLSAKAAPGHEDLSITVLAGEASAVFTGDQIIWSRSVGDALSRAYAAGRSWTAEALEEGGSPFEERRSAVRLLAGQGLSVSSSTSYSREDVEAFAAALAARTDTPAVSAKLQEVDFVHRVFTYTDDQPGLRMDQEDLVRQICALLDQGVTEGTVEARLIRTAPDVIRTDLMNRFGLMNVRSFPTSTRAGDSGLRAVVRALNGVVVQSGGSLSFLAVLEKAGYEPVPFSDDPLPTQIASALMDGALCAGLTAETRFPLTEKSPLIAPGTEAAVGPEQDLVLRNDSGSPACVLCYYTSRSSTGTAGDITIEWYGLTPEAGTSVTLAAEKTRETEPGEPIIRQNSALPPGRLFLIREQTPGEEWTCFLIHSRSGRETRREPVFTTTYPALERIIETNDEGVQP